MPAHWWTRLPTSRPRRGVGAAAMAWASQAHELGRLSFYDPDAASLDTITGFELNSEIEH